MVTIAEKVASYLRQPYARLIVPEDDGTYRAEIIEFPGCIATGDTPAEAFASLEDVAVAWLEAAIDHNQPIPEPAEVTGFSGRLVLRMPKSLHRKSARLAEYEGVSLNQFIVASLAEHIGERNRPKNQINIAAFMSNIKNLGNIIQIQDGDLSPGAQSARLVGTSPWVRADVIPIIRHARA